MKRGDRLPTDLLQRPVEGYHLPAATLGELLDPGPTVLVFLRHFG